MNSAMFTKSTKAYSDIELWHKRIGHINLNKIKAMKSKGVVIRLPTFKEKEIEGVCEACQFGKQHRHPFQKESTSRMILRRISERKEFGENSLAHTLRNRTE